MESFGKKIMAEKFMLNPSFTFLNHGSYGAAERTTFQSRLDFIKDMEIQPDVWFRENILNMWNDNLDVVCNFLGSKRENLVFVNNATTGINCALRSLEWKEGDGILLNSWTYQAVKNVANYLAISKGVSLHFVPFLYPMESCDQIMEVYENLLKYHQNIKLVIIDFISSVPPSLMPINDLISMCRRFDKIVLVDGAHAPGQVPLDLESLDCDFFAGNLHKWCYVPRGCGVLWVRPAFHDKVFPSVISRFPMGGNLSDKFYYQGTSDDTTFYCAGEAIKFYNELGGYDAISKYCSSLVEEGAKLVTEKWKTEQFPLPKDMKAPFMRLVALPKLKKYPIPETDGIHNFVRDLAEMMSDVWRRFKIQSCFLSIHNKPWARLSANVYNSIEDFQKLADAILVLVKEDETSG